MCHRIIRRSERPREPSRAWVRRHRRPSRRGDRITTVQPVIVAVLLAAAAAGGSAGVAVAAGDGGSLSGPGDVSGPGPFTLAGLGASLDAARELAGAERNTAIQAALEGLADLERTGVAGERRATLHLIRAELLVELADPQEAERSLR